MKKTFFALAIFAFVPASFGASPSAKSPAPEQLWKQWYLYKVNGKALGYFEEVMERRPGDKQLAVTQHWVENEEGRTQTYIGAVAADDAELTPVAFFSERKGPLTEYKIDGRAKGGKLSITFKPLKPKGENSRKVVPVAPRMILSNFVPMLLSRHESGKGEFPFTAVVEDARDGKFDSRVGTAEVYGVTKDFKGLTCRRAVVDFAGMEGEWWFTKNGMLCSLEIPSGQSKLELSTEAEAKKALGI